MIARSPVFEIQVCSFAAKMCGAILKVKPREIIKTLTVDAYNRRLFFVVVQTQTFGSHKSRIAIANLDGSKREFLLIKEMSFITTLACDPYKKMLYYTDMHQKNLQGISYLSGKKSVPMTILQKGNIVMHPSGLTWYENQVFIVNLGAKEAIRCYLYGGRKCKAFNLNILNAEDILIDGASRQPMSRNPCNMAKCSGMCVQTEFSYECMCGDSIVSETKYCNVNNEITSSALLIHRENSSNEDPGSSHITAAVWCLVTFLVLLVCGLGYIYYRRKKQGHRDFIRNLHFQNPLASFIPQHGNKTGTLDSGLTTIGSGSSSGTTTASFEVERERLHIGSSIQRFLRGSTSSHGTEILLENAKVGLHFIPIFLTLN